MGPALQMPARHCNNSVRSLGHFNLYTPIKPDSLKFKIQFLSEQYQVWLQNCNTMFLQDVILCNRYIYLYYNEDYVVLSLNDNYFSFDDLVTTRLVSAVRQCVFSYRLVYCRCKIHGLARVFYQVCGINHDK